MKRLMVGIARLEGTSSWSGKPEELWNQIDMEQSKKHHDGADHPIRAYFADAVHHSLHDRLGLREIEDVEQYLANLLAAFLHNDRIFAIRNLDGRPVEAVAEMVMEGDVRLNADSFEREREVHKHIGDFLLFWSGLFPEFLDRDPLIDPVRQGQASYHIVSTFEHDPFGREAPMFRKLSRDFEAFRIGLGLVRSSFEGFSRRDWGLSA